MDWIKDFAKTTPYELDQVTQSFVSLRSYGLNPTDGTLRTLGDTASAMGKGIQQAVEAMADAVVGENERLKEFGIRAARSAEETRFSWTNSSGEAREAIVENNSAIIESTLEAIFNSKYAGAMEEQSKTWNGLISNMGDSWTQFQVDMMQSGVFDYLKSIVTVVGDYMNTAFDSAKNSGKDFAKGVISAIKGTLEAGGFLYDTFEAIGDILKVVWYSGETAFYGIQAVSSSATLEIYEGWNSLGDGIASMMETSANAVQDIFEGAINGIISAINVAISGINMLGGNLSQLQDVKFNDISVTNRLSVGNNTIEKLLRERVVPAKEGFENAKINLNSAYEDLFTSGGGQSFIDEMLSKIDSTFNKISNETSDPIKKDDFGNTPTGDTDNSTFNLQEEIKKQEEYTQKMLEDMDTTREEISDTNDTIKDTTDSFKDFNDLIYNNDDSVNDSINNVTDSFNDFGDSANNVDYSVSKATKALEKFIFQFSDTFINSITDNISSLESIANSGTISTKSYQEALQDVRDVQNELKNNPLSVTIGNEFKTAYDAFISSSTDYLESSNFSNSKDLEFAQRSFNIRSQGFQDTASNTVDVLDSMNTFLESINQAFSDGILTDAERADIKGVAGEVNAKNTTLMGGISSDLIGENSVSAFIKALTSNIDSGVSISDLLNSTTIASVATGLKTDEISNLKNASDKTATATEYMTSNNSTSLRNLQIKLKTTDYLKYWQNGRAYDGDNQQHGGVAEKYEYYADGGFTGNGMGKKDSSGYRQAGIVHEGEYVAPKWMVDSQPQIFNALESARKSKGFAQGGYTSTMKATSNNDGMESIMRMILQEQQKMNATFNRVTENGESMSVILRAG